MEKSRFYENRTQAGKELAKEVARLQLKNPVILALARGGVTVGLEVSREFKAPLDLLLVRKIGAPFNSELALGAVVEGNPTHSVYNKEMISILKVAQTYLEAEEKRQRIQLEELRQKYRAGEHRLSIEHRDVILVDDGIATGASVRAAIEALKNEKPARLVLAVPVCAPDAFRALRSEVTAIVVLTAPEDFQAVGQFFRDFPQVGDTEVIEALKEARNWS